MKKDNFNKNWDFCLNDGKDWDARFESEYKVDLPYDFSFIQERREDAPSGAHGGFFQSGVGKYKKSFSAKKNKKYFFMCDGAFGVTDVFVNSNIALTNKYGYNSFFVDMTDYLRYDKENEILIRVNNKAQPNARWYSGSGIYRDTFICECDSEYIHPFGTFVKTDNIFGKTAYLTAETSVYSQKRTGGVVEFKVYTDNGRKVIYSTTKAVVLDVGENKIQAKLQIDKVRLWDIDTPNLYRIETVLRTEDSYDIDKSTFGVRIINIDSKRGFMLNGKSVKLRGGCIHHDQGVLGTAVYKETEFRRIAKLKEAGFNSVRLSHNPQSQYLYEACDRLGMLVMDELFDYWTEGKKEQDSHVYFKDNWESWTDLIVRRNRCHPSIVMWSTGNEIPQKTGRGDGYYIATEIANKIRNLDTSRPVTHALCSLWDNREEYDRELAENDFPPSQLDYFSRATRVTADTTDIVGYNYLEYRLEKDLERFPNRLIINTETFPICAYTTIKQLLGNPRIVGDYVWTAWDYFGETAIGHVEYNEKRGDFLLPYPYHIANCGDIDICGRRKPQSYYREIAWELRRDPYIAVRHPSLTKTPYFISGWGFYECDESWCFDGYEDEDCEVYVFADCDEVELFVNNESIGKMPKTENGVYKFVTPYKKGKVSANAIVDGTVVGTYEIKTEGKREKLELILEKSYANEESPSIIYVDLEVQDKDGRVCTQERLLVSYETEGADILGVASGELTTKELYTLSQCYTHQGRSLIALKPKEGADKIVLTAKADSLPMAELVIK
ncbi:MAG: DUF4982 domain-containing protein [Clostridia bacterium]|nr:DUF4982 domain-containing protein [Clostridia bacterium]